MRVVHYISTTDNELIARFELLGLLSERHPGTEIRSFQITEEDPPWRDITSILEGFPNTFVDSAWTEYTRDDCKVADVLVMRSSWHYGYPCGIGAKQVAPFLMKQEPSWGRRSIMQLNWVFDEFFVKPDIWESIFRPFGVQIRPVLQYRTRQGLSSVVQLVVSESVETQIQGLPFKTCSYGRCDRRKYMPIAGRGLPAPRESAGPMFRSREYFGDWAFNAIYVVRPLYLKLIAAGVRGVTFSPV